jgi:hypothetical protein
MPEKPWSQEFVDYLMTCMSDLVECADLSDDETDALTAFLFPKFMQSSGLSLAQFRAMVLASCAELRREGRAGGGAGIAATTLTGHRIRLGSARRRIAGFAHGVRSVRRDCAGLVEPE